MVKVRKYDQIEEGAMQDDNDKSIPLLKESIKKMKIENSTWQEVSDYHVSSKHKRNIWNQKRSIENCLESPIAHDSALKYSRLFESNGHYAQQQESPSSLKTINELLKELHFLRMERLALKRSLHVCMDEG